MIKELKKEALIARRQKSHLGPILQYHIAEINKIGKDKGRKTSEDEAIQYVKKVVQKLKEDEYADKMEISVLSSILPAMASEEEVKEFLSTLDEGLNKGQIMKAVRDKYGALVDMKMVSGLV